MDIPPLLAAARDGDLEGVQRLVAQGYDVNAPDANGVTAYDIANMNKKFNIMQWIQRNGGGGHGSTADFTFSFDSGDLNSASEIRHILVGKGYTVHMMNDERHESWKENWKRSAHYSGTEGRAVVMFYSRAYEAKVKSGDDNACYMEFEYIKTHQLNTIVLRGDIGRDLPGSLFIADGVPNMPTQKITAPL
eukprot:SAG31_NODE_2060_length_6538_cov_10.244448_2_plen_191_part_00